MKNTNKKRILVRYLGVIVINLLLASCIVFKMSKLTVVQAKAWNDKANTVLTQEKTLAPPRGKILADDGSVLAANLNYYTARIDWTVEGFDKKKFYASLDTLCDSLAAFKPGKKSAKQWHDDLVAQQEAHKNTAYPLFTNLTHLQFVRLKSFPFLKLGKNKNGFYSEPMPRRIKPYGMMASRSIGSIGEDTNNKELHGHSGLEMALDTLLYGVPGVKRYTQLTNRLVECESTPAKPGYDITTTINIQLQDIVENELVKVCRETDAQWGTCVLMEVATGEIKAISNLKRGESGEYFEGENHAVLGYEPGSVMKPISMMVALEDSIDLVADINAPIATGSIFRYGDSEIKDPHGATALSPRQIIERSSNIGMSKIIIRKYGNNPGGFRDRLEQMGFFEPFNTGIAGERVPRIHRFDNTNEGRVALTRQAYGYATEIPPLHVLAMYNAIANDGKYVRPHLVKKLSRAGEPDSIIPTTYVRDRVCSPENAEKLRQMLHDVVWGSYGTARKWVQDDNVEIAGKTGTAYIVTPRGYGEVKRLAFCGFFPYAAPKYSCIVLMLGANRGAGASSGMVVKNIAAKMYSRGLLGRNNNYDTSTTPKRDTQSKTAFEPVPTLYSNCSTAHVNEIKKFLNAPKAKMFTQSSASSSQGVPNVCGLNLRDAVARLEKRGLNVRFKGVGRVLKQSLPAGSAFNRGAMITLELAS